VEHLPLEVRLVHGVVVDDAESADSGGREIERRRRAEPACPDQKDARVEQPALAFGADLWDQKMAAVASELRAIEASGELDRVSVLAPVLDSAGHRRDVCVAELEHHPRTAQGSVACRAIEEDRPLEVGRRPTDFLPELVEWHVERPWDTSCVPLVLPAHVDEQRRILFCQERTRTRHVDLTDLAPYQLLLFGHNPSIARASFLAIVAV
jgi:hypothetical protein